MSGAKRQIIKGIGNIMAGGDINITTIMNNENHINLYEKDIVEVVDFFSQNIDLFSDEASTEGGNREFDYAEKEEKNRLNNLSPEYFCVLKEEFLPYFNKIEKFLKSPQNKEVKKMYKKVALRVKVTLTANEKKFDGFEEVISDVANNLSRRIEGRTEIDPLLITVFLNFMYWNCDIGRKE